MTQTDPLSAISTRRTSQRERARADQVVNNAGGFVFAVTPETRFRRFLVLGTTGGTYYVSQAELTRENAQEAESFIRSTGLRAVEIILEISEGGRAPKQNATLFALALAASVGDEETRDAALAAIPRVARTGTMLFQFLGYLQQFRGWGEKVTRAVSRWYLAPEVDQVAYQAVKYRSRGKWTHRDVLRKAHPKTDDPQRDALFKWIVSGEAEKDGTASPALVYAFLDAQEVPSVANWVRLIEKYPLSWEMLPDAALGEPDVWRALIQKGMPITALIRQLPRLTRLGLFDDRDVRNLVTGRITDAEVLKRGRVHPMNVLVAQRTYAGGQGASSTWTPNRHVTDALDAAFYRAFGAVEPASKRTLIGLDVSGSMGQAVTGLGAPSRTSGWGYAAGPGQVSCYAAGGALSLVTMATEPECEIVGFSHQLVPVPISPRQRLDDVIHTIQRIPMGSTDCALPMIHATQNKLAIDTFLVITDSETWAGGFQPFQALRQYREQSGINAKLVVIGMTSSGFSIADPQDAGMLDLVGLDSAGPGLVANFSAGRV
jgi:60 kDa SS-A/Ro ribonucleoprotein